MLYSKIILCGLRCTGKTSLFWDLQKALSWPTFTVSQYLRDYIHRFHLTADQVNARSTEVSRDIDERMLALLASPNHVVIDARVFGYIDRTYPNTLKLLLTASDEVRVKRAALREKTPIERQTNRLIPREAEWIAKIQNLYKRTDLFDPKHYDLVIDTGSKTPEEILRLTLQIINS